MTPFENCLLSMLSPPASAQEVATARHFRNAGKTPPTTELRILSCGDTVSMQISSSAKKAALQSLVNIALTIPGDLARQHAALVGSELLNDISDKSGDIERGPNRQTGDSVFSAGFQLAERPQVGA